MNTHQQHIFRSYIYPIQVCVLIGISCCLLLFPVSISAQEAIDQIEVRELDQEQVESYRQDKAFQYGLEPLPEIDEPYEPWFQVGNLEGWLYVLYGLVFLVIGGLIFFTVRTLLGKQNKQIDTDVIPDLEEIDIRETDLGSLLQQCIDQQDYRSGIRLLYLQVLKQLSAAEWIDWKPHKTNQIYETEMANRAQSGEFTKLTMGYEYIWYGNVPIELDLFTSLQRRFKTFQQQIPTQS